MADEVYYLSRADRDVLREMAAEYRQRRGSRVGRDTLRLDHPAPEVYMAYTPPIGIPSLQNGIPGSMDCLLYQNVADATTGLPTLEEMTGTTKTVYNLSTTAIPGDTFIPIARDKWGSWVALIGVNISETIGTGTATDTIMGPSGPSHAAGDVPDPGSTAGTTRFLREDATWASPSVALSQSTATVTIGFSSTVANTLTAVNWTGGSASGLFRISGTALQLTTGNVFLLMAYATRAAVAAGTFGLWVGVAGGSDYGQANDLASATGMTTKSMTWCTPQILFGGSNTNSINVTYFMTSQAQTTFSVQAIQLA